MLRGMLAVMMVAAMTGALGLFGPDPVAAQGTPSATRSFDQATVSPGGQVTVTINASNYGPSGSVTERLPQGFSYVSSSLDLDPERVDVDPQQVTFTLQEEAPFTYTVTAPNEADSYTFSGTLSDSEGNDHAVDGDDTVTVEAAATGDPLVDRYDDNNNGKIDKSEVIAAINDYLFGAGPNAITKADVIRLINLYLFGPTTAQPPGAPTNLTATANGQTRIDLSWTDPANDGGAAITGYRVEVSTDGSSWSDLVANTDSTAVSYSHTGLTAVSVRHYRVSAINSAGTGPASNVATATTDSVPAGPDLIVEPPKVSDSSLDVGASFTLRATVRNQGSSASVSTTLHYYRSTDSTITSSDTPVGTDAVGSLVASGTSGESIDLSVPSRPGTYYYGACVDVVSGEANTGNNCSEAVMVTVEKRPDLVVEQPTVTNFNPEPEASFILRATVRNQGTSASVSTILRYYRSTDSTITSSDTPVGTDAVGSLAAPGTSGESIPLNAPSDDGPYYYGACVDAVSGESDTGNNCSSAVKVTVEARPDLIVERPSADNPNPDPGASFTLSATVRNEGSGASDSTTLRYYRSTDPTITTSDAEVGTESVGIVAPSGAIAKPTAVTAESGDGTYYYGACVDAVARESDTGNNCSEAVTVTVPAR